MARQILGIIPARYGSTRLMGKLMLPVLGKPLIHYTIENAKKISSLNHLIVATDDSRIFKYVQSLGCEALMTSAQCLTGTDRLAEALSLHPEWLKADAIINLQGDEPCVEAKAINQAIKILLQDQVAVMSTLITPLTNKEEALSSSTVKCVIDQFSNALYFSRALIPHSKSQTFHPHISYYRHIGLYVYRPSFLITYSKLTPTPLQIEEDLEQLKVLENGYRIKAALTFQSSIGVDVAEDIKRLEEYLCLQNTSL